MGHPVGPRRGAGLPCVRGAHVPVEAVRAGAPVPVERRRGHRRDRARQTGAVPPRRPTSRLYFCNAALPMRLNPASFMSHASAGQTPRAAAIQATGSRTAPSSAMSRPAEPGSTGREIARRCDDACRTCPSTRSARAVPRRDSQKGNSLRRVVIERGCCASGHGLDPPGLR